MALSPKSWRMNRRGSFLSLELLEDRTLLSNIPTVMADFNGDGAPDLAMADVANNTVTVRLANRVNPALPSYLPPHTYAVGVEPDTVEATDVNNDGKPDLIAVNATQTTASVLLGNGDGTFQTQYTTSLVSVLTVSGLSAGRFFAAPPPPPGSTLITAASRALGSIPPVPVIQPPLVALIALRGSGQGGGTLPGETRVSATASAQGSGVDILVAPGEDRLAGGLLGPSDQLFLGVGNDLVSGIDLAGSLLTGGRAVPNLVARKGTSLAPVATVSDSADEAPVAAVAAAQETPWIDFVVGLDETIAPRYPAFVKSGSDDEGLELDQLNQAGVDEELASSTGPDTGTDGVGTRRAGSRRTRAVSTEVTLALVAMLLASGFYQGFSHGGGWDTADEARGKQDPTSRADVMN